MHGCSAAPSGLLFTKKRRAHMLGPYRTNFCDWHPRNKAHGRKACGTLLWPHGAETWATEGGLQDDSATNLSSVEALSLTQTHGTPKPQGGL